MFSSASLFNKPANLANQVILMSWQVFLKQERVAVGSKGSNINVFKQCNCIKAENLSIVVLISAVLAKFCSASGTEKNTGIRNSYI